jgi:hypothetical protein
MVNLPEAYGTWEVTTEGDCEGRTTTHLGTHTGYLDDIAFALADRQYYGLQFKPVELLNLKKVPPKATQVNVSLSIDTGTWDLKGEERANAFRQILKGRKTRVSSSKYYACVTLSSGLTKEEQEEARLQVLRNAALAKLTPQDRAALGF